MQIVKSQEGFEKRVLAHISNLDGLRAYAVIAVMLYHIDHVLFPYGWLGVHAFFMLSGFLITRILLSTKESISYFKTFYIRRTLRIFPIYYLCLFIVLAYTLYRNVPNRDFFYYLFYVQNFRLGLDDFSSQFPYFFNHSWSLAIEEQYYLFWPLIVRYTSTRKLIWICIGGILISIISKLTLLQFTSLPIVWTNMFGSLDMLCAGSLLATILFTDTIKYLKHINLIAAMGVVIYFVLAPIIGYQNFFLSRITRVASIDGILLLMIVLLLVFCLLKYLVRKDNWFTKIFFSNPVTIYIGKISYGIYLYHFIIYFIIEGYFNTNEGIVVKSLKFILPIIVAALSYALVEKPILRLKSRFKYF